MRTVWFSGWFSAITLTIMDIHKKLPHIKVIGSHTNEHCTYSPVVEGFYVEDKGMTPEQYVEWAVRFCKEHDVKLFFPKKHMGAIAESIEKFEAIGVVVACDKTELHQLFESKQRAYTYLHQKGYDRIPKFEVVNNLREFISSYIKLEEQGETVCFKYDKDEGASSFRVIDDAKANKLGLEVPPCTIISYESAVNLLVTAYKGNFKDLMVMPKLSSPEISVDCYNSAQVGFIAIPRYKLSGRIKQIKFDKEVTDDCKRLQDLLGFTSAFNVQYRWDREGKLKLLEINTRLSGGIQISSMSGVSIPCQIISDKLNLGYNQSLDGLQECLVTQYETPRILE